MGYEFKDPLMKALLEIVGDDPDSKVIVAESLAEMIMDQKEGPPMEFSQEPRPDMLERIKLNRDKLKETEAQHALAEKRLPKHDWLDWYAAFISSRNAGLGPKSAALNADMYIRWLMKKVASAEAAPTPAPVQSDVTKEERAQTEKDMDAGMTGGFGEVG